MWLTLIALHAASGVASFVSGWLGLVPSRRTASRPWLFQVYLGGLVGMVVFMAGAIGAQWQQLEGSRRAVFAGLFALGVYMLYRTFRARTEQLQRAQNWELRYIDHVGFTLISLFDGFVIVAAIDLGAPGWLVAVIAVAGVFAGVKCVARAKKDVTRPV